ncbi:hypothetical protein LCGC14_2017810 [marine sediment metagenome]|uniref:Uncharacterized protein n=1 Tax=marine sediment metagenome TaxID=412755 RepID=A0A0F9EYL6_9ZZZZ
MTHPQIMKKLKFYFIFSLIFITLNACTFFDGNFFDWKMNVGLIMLLIIMKIY